MLGASIDISAVVPWSWLRVSGLNPHTLPQKPSIVNAGYIGTENDVHGVSGIDWVKSQAADFVDTGIQKLVPRYDKCLNSGGEYVEK